MKNEFDTYKITFTDGPLPHRAVLTKVARMSDTFRGYDIEISRDGFWLFVDTGKSVAETWRSRPCGFCGQPNTPEGHDGCLGTIVGVVNACCGHGVTGSAYIQFEDGSVSRGAEAIAAMKGLLG